MKKHTLKKRLTTALIAIGLPVITIIPSLAQGTAGSGSAGSIGTGGVGTGTTNSSTLSNPPGTTTAPLPSQQTDRMNQGTTPSTSPSYNTNTGTLNNTGTNTNSGTTAPYNPPLDRPGGTNPTNTGVPAGANPATNGTSSGSVPSSNGTYTNPAAGSFPSGQPPATKPTNDPAIVIPLPSDTASRNPR